MYKSSEGLDHENGGHEEANSWMAVGRSPLYSEISILSASIAVDSATIERTTTNHVFHCSDPSSDAQTSENSTIIEQLPSGMEPDLAFEIR